MGIEEGRDVLDVGVSFSNLELLFGVVLALLPGAGGGLGLCGVDELLFLVVAH